MSVSPDPKFEIEKTASTTSGNSTAAIQRSFRGSLKYAWTNQQADVANDWQWIRPNKGLGKALQLDDLTRIEEAAHIVAARAVMAHAIEESTASRHDRSLRARDPWSVE